jgi:hypothetical protein
VVSINYYLLSPSFIRFYRFIVFPLLPANVSINLPIGPLIIMAIIGLKSPSKSSLTALDVSETASILAVM